MFAIELAVKTYLAPKRMRYLRNNWFDVVFVAVPFLRPLRIVRSVRVLRALRASRALSLFAKIAENGREVFGRHTAVIGAYFLLLGLVGLWKFRLVPDLAEAAPFVEAIGAAVIMLPSMIQSLEAGGGRYEWIVLAEAVAFFVASIGLRRRGMLAAAIVAMVLVASRVLFDAVNALPNWVVVMLAGMALLGIGMGILLGRERWDRWQESLLGWWADGAGAALP